MARRPSKARSYAAAAIAAGGDRTAVNEAIAAQPLPYITDVSGGFMVHLQPEGPGEHRYLKVILEAPEIEVALYDTAETGENNPDRALVERISASDWDEASAFMERAGARLAATVGGKPAALRTEGRSLAVCEAGPDGEPGAVKALIDFVNPKRSFLIQATLAKGDRVAGLDWIIMEDRMLEKGIGLKPAAVEPVPAPRP